MNLHRAIEIALDEHKNVSDKDILRINKYKKALAKLKL